MSPRHVYDLMQRGEIPYRQFGMRRVVPRVWLDKQVQQALQPDVIDLGAVRRRRKRR